MFEKMIKTQTAKQAKMLDDWLEKREKEYPFPSGVLLSENIDYYGDGKECHRVDVFKPENVDEKLPVIINIHGGGFLLGKKEANRHFCAELCKKGFVAFCLEYPLVPDVDIFEVFRDLTIGINKAAELAESFGGDGKDIYLCGDSAGAYLCVYLASLQKSEAMRKAANVGQIVPKIKALGLISGMFYTTKFDQIGMFIPKMAYGKEWKKSEFFPYTNPENSEITENLPPCFLVTSTGDFLEKYSKNYVRALDRGGVENVLVDFENKKYGHAYVAMRPELDESAEAIADIADFFKEHKS